MSSEIEEVNIPPVDKKFILNCGIALSLVGFIQAYMGAAMPFVRDTLSLSTDLVAWHFSLYALGRLSSGYIVTTILRLISHSKAILIFGFGLIGLAALLALSISALLTLPLAYCIGLSGGTTQAVAQTQIGTLSGKTREVALAQALVWAGGGSMIAPLLIGWLSKNGYSWSFTLIIPLSFAIFMLTTGNSLENGNHQIDKKPINTPISATVIAFWILVICGNALEWTIGFWGAQFIEITHQLPKSTAVYMMTLFFSGIILGRLWNVYLLRKYDCDVLYVVYVAASGISLSVLFFAPNLYISGAALSISGVAIGCLYPNNMSTAMKYAPNEIIRITTGAAKCSGLSLLTFPLIMGYLGSAIGLEKAILIIIAIPVMMILLIVIIRRNRQLIIL